MAKEDIVRRWLEIAAEDLEVAESNHSNSYWLYAASLHRPHRADVHRGPLP
ncbi:MAG: hypothetical protein IJ081_00850 [Prevotella sp.]|nr:hypothetical protein [Prevotella sp.]